MKAKGNAKKRNLDSFGDDGAECARLGQRMVVVAMQESKKRMRAKRIKLNTRVSRECPVGSEQTSVEVKKKSFRDGEGGRVLVLVVAKGKTEREKNPES